MKKRPNQRPGASAFTMVELLVVIGIIALLMSMFLGGLSMLRERSRVRQSSVLLQGCRNMVTEYENQLGRPKMLADIGSLEDTDPTPPPLPWLPEQEWLPKLLRIPLNNDAFAKLPNEMVKQESGGKRLVDAWGHYIWMRFDPTLGCVFYSQGSRPERRSDWLSSVEAP